MNARTFTTVGMVRNTKNDFTDDGAGFRGYDWNGLQFTYTTYAGQMYLSLRLDYMGFESNDYINHKIWMLGDKYNGATMKDISREEFENWLVELLQLFNEFKEEIANKDASPVDIEPMMKQLETEKSALEELALTAVMELKVGYERYSYGMEAMKTIMRTLTSVKDKMEKLSTYEQKELRRLESSFKKTGYMVYNQNCNECYAPHVELQKALEAQKK